MINRTPPTDWRDLQLQVGTIFRECGLKSETDKEIETVRGNVKVDVFAEDATNPPTIYLCECKHWKSNVPKQVVHAFRTVVADYGANWGFIISSAGFQSGAREAVTKSNLRLLTWSEFEGLFTDRWLENYMLPRMREEVGPLVEYTEPVNSRVFRKADALSHDSKRTFMQLRKKYGTLAFFALLQYVDTPWRQPLSLPLRASDHKGTSGFQDLPDDLVDATCFRDFLDIICRHAKEAVKAFDLVFGGRV